MPTKVHYSQGYGFSSSHVWMQELNHKEGWALKKWYFEIVVLEKNFESPLDCKEIQLVNFKGIQPWIFIGRTDAKAETPILWPPDVKTWLTGKAPDVGKDWRQKEKGKQRMRWLYSEMDGETVETVSDFIFGAPKSLQMMTTAMKLKDTYSLE